MAVECGMVYEECGMVYEECGMDVAIFACMYNNI